MVTRHEFLAELHRQLQPRGYLEVGVHAGDSLRIGTCPRVGIDPNPVIREQDVPGGGLYVMTSDTFFERMRTHDSFPLAHLDLAFVDGMHLVEYALRDFMNIERHANARTVVAFDDVLPRNQAEASRTQCPGDWTGDVWKIVEIMLARRLALGLSLVDTFPTGTLLLWDLDPNDRTFDLLYDDILAEALPDRPVPPHILDRTLAVSPAVALETLGRRT